MEDGEKKEPQNRIEVENLTLREIFLNIKPKVLWSIMTILVGLIAGSIGLGYKLASVKLDGAQLTNRKLVALQSKEKFLTLLIRYEKAEANWDYSYKHGLSDLDEKEEVFIRANKALHNHIAQLIEKGDIIEDVSNLQGVTVGKGSDETNVTIKFNYDGTVWKVPDATAKMINLPPPGMGD